MSDIILEKLQEDMKKLSPEDHSSKAMSIRLSAAIMPHIFKFLDDELAAATIQIIPLKIREERARSSVEAMLGLITNIFANNILATQAIFQITHESATAFCLLTFLEYLAIHDTQRKKLGIGIEDPNSHSSMDMYFNGKKEPFDIVKILEAMKKGQK